MGVISADAAVFVDSICSAIPANLDARHTNVADLPDILPSSL